MFDHKTGAEVREQVLIMVEEYCSTLHNKEGPFKGGSKVPYAPRIHDCHKMMDLVGSALEFWFASDRFTSEFEKKLVDYLRIRFCSLVNSGSSTNLAVLVTLASPPLGKHRIKRRGEVITAACDFPVTVVPVLQYGVVPVFMDVTILQYNMDVAKLEEAFSDRTKVVMIAHTLDNLFDLRAMKSLCERHNLWLVKDNCDALGSRYIVEAEGREQARFTGTIGDIETLGFYPPYHMAMGEDEVVCTDNPLLNKIIRSFHDWGRDCVCPSGWNNVCEYRFDKQFGELPLGYDHKYVYPHLGYNLRATDMQASIGYAQIEKLPSFAKRRRYNFARLKAGLRGLEDKLILPEAAPHSEPNWFDFLIACREGVDQNQVVWYMEGKGVQARVLFADNLTKHSCSDEMRNTDTGYGIMGELANTDRVMSDTLWVGVCPGITGEMIDHMVKIICEAVGAQ